MRTSEHYFKNTIVQVTPTMEALGDQPYRCVVTDRATGLSSSVIVEASYRFIAAREAERIVRGEL